MARPKLGHLWRPQRKEILGAAVAVLLWLPIYFYLNHVGENLPYVLPIALSVQTVAILWHRRYPTFTLGLTTLTMVAYTSVVLYLQITHGSSALQMREHLSLLLHLGLIIWAPLVVVFSISHQHRHTLENEIARLTLQNQQIQQLSIVSERARIAREMHDIIAHSLSVMITLADGAKANLGKNPEQTEKALTLLTSTGRTALSEARRLVNVLRNPEGESTTQPEVKLTESRSDPNTPLSPQPTYEDIKTLIQRFLDAGLPIESRLDETPPPEDPGLNLTLFRIVQESLTNILRYAPQTPKIIITTERALGSITVTVENALDPKGKITPGSGKGIVGMKERVSVYNGQIEAGPSKLGWKVKAILRWTETSSGMTAWKAPL